MIRQRKRLPEILENENWRIINERREKKWRTGADPAFRPFQLRPADPLYHADHYYDDFTSIYGVVDGLFVSNVVGKTEFAALNFVFPFIMVLGGAGFMIGTGGTALVAQQLGQGNKQKANHTFTTMVSFTIFLGVILTAIGIAVIRPVCVLLGATPE